MSPLLGGLGIALSLVIHQLWIMRYVFRRFILARSHGDSHVISSRSSNLNRPNISSLTNDARELLNGVRTHWGIENAVHWVLDVAFGEDNSRVRVGNSAENFSILRRMALNMLKSETTLKVGVAAKRKRAGWDGEYLLKVFAQ